jgi:sphingolipid delta-4 desaturase
MGQAKTDFFYSEANQPHPGRAKAMLAKYPEIRKLFGAEPRTMFVILSIVFFQTTLAAILGMAGFKEYWWLAMLVAYFFGAFFNHSTFVIIHECSHNAVFTSKIWNRFAACLVDLVSIFPSAEGFKVYHIRHHAHQGDYEFDADLPYYKEARFVKNNPFFKALWLLFFPIVQGSRPFRLKKIKMWNSWVIINTIFNVAYAVFMWQTFGINSVFYLFMSFAFSIGLHPLGARWIQEHYTPEGNPQESFNYKGSLNIPSLYVGLHNEHHDFPNIPWSRLPELEKIAPDFYSTLEYHPSWFRLFFNFLFQDRYDLFSRVLRSKEGKESVDSQFMERNEMVLSKVAAEQG